MRTRAANGATYDAEDFVFPLPELQIDRHEIARLCDTLSAEDWVRRPGRTSAYSMRLMEQPYVQLLLGKFSIHKKFRGAALMRLEAGGEINIHIDDPQRTCAINIPISGDFSGSRTYFYDPALALELDLARDAIEVNDETHHLHHEFSDRAVLELDYGECPVLFNTKVPHSVVYFRGKTPRILLTLCFLAPYDFPRIKTLARAGALFTPHAQQETRHASPV